MYFARSMSNKYGKKLVDTAKKSATDAIKTASKRVIQKTVEATDDLIGNKIADKIRSISKKKSDNNDDDNDDDNNNNNNNSNNNVELTTPKKDTYRQKKENKLLMN